ncbi:selenophosphate synthase [Bacillus sp. OV194]|nr:selenophosphate synthase [Bacillus sp. OV194]
MIVGLETSDDAGVYKLSEEVAMIQTVDFFTPIVDDPYMFGQIAAANALSDVYAMGGTPKTVLNIVGFPLKKLGHEVLAEILKGAADKVQEAGALIVGGHSIDDQEPKFGLSVTGFAHPAQIYKNVGLKPGDALILTKPIGIGIQTTAIKQNRLNEGQVRYVSEIMASLNKTAAECLANYQPNAVTDVTGFGLLGHASEMAKGSESVSVTLSYSRTPVVEGTEALAMQGVVPGGTKANHQWIEDLIRYDESLTETQQWILCDAVTSGGLLVSLPENQADAYLRDLHSAGLKQAAKIGSVTERKERLIIIEP